MILEATINGEVRHFEHEPWEMLTEVLRRNGLIGTKRGCETGDCGACTVLLDDTEVNSCILLAAQASGHDILTIEGMGDATRPHPIQEAFVDAGAVQCGFCTPGMVLGTKALLDQNPDPTRDEAHQALAGHLCRCTGYVKCADAVLDSAERMKKERGAEG
jgi:carbon-monoxide dehydrogenase small subunit